jgi:hypothetical protein
VDERLNNPPSPALATRPPAGLDAPSTAPADRKDQRLTEGTLPPAAEDASRLRRRLAEADRTVKEEAAPATTMRAAPRQAGELGAVLVPTPDRNVLWRGRDNAIEQSGDGGLTWRPERTVSGTIVGGSAPTPEVVWFAVNNPNGLVLRRTPAGWSGTATFDAAIVAIRATSTTQATVEVIGGRQFDTTDGGATWKPR